METRERIGDTPCVSGGDSDFILNRRLEVVWYWNIVREMEKIIPDI